MEPENPNQLKQNEAFVEYSRVQRLVEMKMDAITDTFNLTFNNNRLLHEKTGQVVVKCRLPGKESVLTLKYGEINEVTLERLVNLSIQQQEMLIATKDRHSTIAGWLGKSLKRISDLRLGRDMLDLLSSQAQLVDAPDERRPALRFYLDESLRKEVNDLTRNLLVRSDGVQQIQTLLDLAGPELSNPMLRYGLNAVNLWNAPQLLEALERIAEHLSLPDDVRRSAASFL